MIKLRPNNFLAARALARIVKSCVLRASLSSE